MLHQELISIDDAWRWDEVLASLPHAPAHTAHYNRAMMMSSQRPTYLYYARTDDFIAACPVAKRSKFETHDLVTPYGFGGFIASGECAQFAEQFDAFMQSQHILSSYLAVHPVFCRSNSILNLCEATTSAIYLLDLQQDIATLYANLDKTHRYEIKQSNASAIQLLESTDEIMANLVVLYRDTLTRTGAASVYHFTEATLAELMRDKKTLAFAANVAGKMVAMTILLYNDHIADYFINAANDAGREYSRILIWKAMEYLHNIQVPTLNLGGGVKPGDNLEQFKKRFSGKKVMPYVLKRIYDDKLYKDVCARSQIDAEATHYFPAYHAIIN